jgi:cytochrome c peroxidase
MGNSIFPLLLAALLTFGTLFNLASDKPQSGAVPVAVNSPINLGGRMPPSFDQEVARVIAELDRIEADTLSHAEPASLDRQGQVRTLGKLLLFDKHLSVNQNEACSFCHMPETGFTGPIQSFNSTTVSYPGSVRTRFSNRKPQSYMYAPFAPVLHYNAYHPTFGVPNDLGDIHADDQAEDR